MSFVFEKRIFQFENMLRRGSFIFLVIFIAALLNENDACFRSNQHRESSLSTGSSFYQDCMCEDPEFTLDDLQWLDIHDQPVRKGPGTNNVVYTEATNGGITLIIRSISKSMSGTYKCVTVVEGVRYVQEYIVYAYEPVFFFKTPNDQHLILERNSTIACEARGDSLPRISWQKKVDDEFADITPNAEKYEILPEGLLVKNVSKEDAGKYKCTALVINTAEEVDKFIDVDVQAVPVITDIKAYPDSTVVVGEPLSIDCIAEGVPTPQYAWKKIEKDRINSTETWKQKFNTINFDSIHPDDEGLYECYAYNEPGGFKKLINVEVLVPPSITYFPNITEVEGTTIQLICNATGKPEPNLSIIYEGWDFRSDWELSEYEIVPNKGFITLERSSEGIYVCNASNEVGYEMVPMYLTVLHRPYFKDNTNRKIEWGYDGKTVHLSCAHDSNPPAVITWRFESNDIPTEEQVEINKSLDHVNNMLEQYLTLSIDKNTTYGMYACTAKNAHGEATKIVTLKEGFRPPAIEGAINITAITATTVTFDIEGLFKEDIPEIIGYTAQYDEKSNYNITDIHPNRTWSIDRPFRIEKLKPNTTYFVSFAAINEVGVGDYSNRLEFNTLEKSVPESPVFEEVIARSSAGNHLLKWKEADDNGEPIDYYVLKYCPVYDELDDRLCEERNVPPTTELELTDLELNTTYYLELIAHNAEGNSTPANMSVIIPVLQEDEKSATLLSGGAIIGISVIIVLVCLLLLDLLLLVWRRQGILATCCFKKDKKTKEDALNARDKKGLLIVEPIDTRPDNGHREYEYNKNTGVVTGKHSAV